MRTLQQGREEIAEFNKRQYEAYKAMQPPYQLGPSLTVLYHMGEDKYYAYTGIGDRTELTKEQADFYKE
jgi:hypothetical protein